LLRDRSGLADEQAFAAKVGNDLHPTEAHLGQPVPG
jgi:hypothetical protein